ncbi:alcohol dehydrogenase family protein [Vibrio sp. HN007]|uniref:alcohol dehydrogenase family protein n=1 Tax=Vibrio iocasae TaxID=3098914 RepID=UPI0035D499AF
MKAVQLTGHGGPEKLFLNEAVSVPELCNTDVLIKVAAAGVNNTDINTRIGWYSKSNDSDDASWAGKPLPLPLIQGADVCGVIVAVGSEVSQDRIGERVIIEPCIIEADGKVLDTSWYFGSECNGGFSEYTKVASRHAFKVDCDLSDVELASFPCSYSTAENLLTRANVKQGDRVLISGASGGVGSAAIQLAKARGAYTIAITTQSKSQSLLDIGADETIDRNQNLIDELGTNSVDVVVDLVAGNQWPQFLEVLRPKGRYAVSGAIGGAMVELDVRTLYLKDLSFFGCTFIEPEVFPNLVNHIEQGRISPLVAQTFSLENIVQAQEEFEKKKHIGKIVLKVS